MKQTSYILGIDPGTGRTGWGVIKTDSSRPDGILEYVAHGCIVTTLDDIMPRRLQILYESVNGLISKFKPESVVVEQIFFGRNQKTAISVSQARGVIMLAVAGHSLPMHEYTSIAVKHYLSGYGKMEKKDMQILVRELLKKDNIELSFNTKDKAFDDAADALAIAIHHAWKLQGRAQIILEKPKKPVAKKKKIRKLK